MGNREIIFWSCVDKDLPYGLIATSIDDAIEIALLGHCAIEERPEVLTVYGLARLEIVIPPGSALDCIIENIDEEYGDPDGDNFEPTQAMKDAEKAFLDIVISEYVPWAYEVIATRVINVAEWKLGRDNPGTWASS